MSMDRKPAFDWNDKVTALAKEMFESGWRSTEIAAIIGTTRDTVTAKATRCKWDKAMRRQYGADRPIPTGDHANYSYAPSEDAVSYRAACDAHLADLQAAHGSGGFYPAFRIPAERQSFYSRSSAFDRMSVIGSQF